MNAYELVPQIERWLGEYNDEETSDERRLELERMLQDAEGMVGQKCDAIQDWIDETLKATVAVLDEAIKRRQVRKKSAESQIERCKRLQHFLLGGQPMKTPENTFYYAANKVVVIDDPTAIPEAYMRRPDPEPMKREILAAIASGQSVPGARIETTEPTLRVR